jgi:phosphoribosylanthranilate isomerase
MSRTRIKICGITRLEDALLAAELGADAIGFVFAPSRRQIAPAEARRIVRALPSFVTTVGVFVDDPLEHVRSVQSVSGMDRVQLHGDETPDFVERLGLRTIKAIRVRSRGDVTSAAAFAHVAEALLFDAPAGGSGRRFDLELLTCADSPLPPFFLAGGLDASNVAAALRESDATAVDVASGVESAPGYKDPDRLAQFVDAVRRFDRERAEPAAPTVDRSVA